MDCTQIVLAQSLEATHNNKLFAIEYSYSWVYLYMMVAQYAVRTRTVNKVIDLFKAFVYIGRVFKFDFLSTWFPSNVRNMIWAAS